MEACDKMFESTNITELEKEFIKFFEYTEWGEYGGYLHSEDWDMKVTRGVISSLIKKNIVLACADVGGNAPYIYMNPEVYKNEEK